MFLPRLENEKSNLIVDSLIEVFINKDFFYDNRPFTELTYGFIVAELTRKKDNRPFYLCKFGKAGIRSGGNNPIHGFIERMSEHFKNFKKCTEKELTESIPENKKMANVFLRRSPRIPTYNELTKSSIDFEKLKSHFPKFLFLAQENQESLIFDAFQRLDWISMLSDFSKNELILLDQESVDTFRSHLNAFTGSIDLLSILKDCKNVPKEFNFMLSNESNSDIIAYEDFNIVSTPTWKILNPTTKEREEVTSLRLTCTTKIPKKSKKTKPEAVVALPQEVDASKLKTFIETNEDFDDAERKKLMKDVFGM